MTDDPPRQDIAADRDAYVAARDLNVHHHYGQPRAKTVQLRVLVSWTSDDLRDHREQVSRALRRLGAMEVVLAPDAHPLEEHLAEVRSCDLVLGVFAWRYGPVPEGQSCSLPELELRAAQEAGVPCLAFLLDERVPWPPGAMDRGEAGDRIYAFREELDTWPDCEKFTSAADLAARVEELVGSRTASGDSVPRADLAVAGDWRTYRRRLVEEYGRLDLEALTPPEREEYLQLGLRDVFVEPDVREDAPPVELSKELWRKLKEATELSPSDIPRGLDREDLEKAGRDYRTRPGRALFDVVSRPAERLCVLLGDPGAGKSTIARYLALAIAQDRLPRRLAELDGHQPVLIELRDYAAERARRQCADFGDYLAHRARADGLGLPTEALLPYLASGGLALVIFDGLDELFDPREREAVAREIAWFASSYPTARVLVTSRIVGYRRRILAEAGFTHYTVQDLSADQIKEFLTSWYGLALHDRPAMAERHRLRLTQALEESPSIRELAGNPLLLTILAIIGKHRELPRERWKVYDHAAGVLVEHWDVNKHLRDSRVDADVIREDDKKDLLRRLAYRMQLGAEGLAGNHIWMDDLVGEIVDFLRDRFQYDLARATAIANTIVAQFHERNFVLARYGPRVYGFVHRALLEFFCAGEIVRRFEKSRTLTEEQLGAEVFETHWEDPAWTEVLRLVTGMVDATVTDRLLVGLLQRAEPVRTTVLDKPPLGAVTLAVQCLAEVRGLGSAERSASVVLDAIIDLLRAPDRHFADERETRLEMVILPAVAVVGPSWPGRDRFLRWFREHSAAFVTWRTCRFAPRVLAALYSDTPAVRSMLVEMARQGGPSARRRACLLAVADHWPDLPETRDLLTDLVHDHAASVRQAAIEQLAAKWTNVPGTRSAVQWAAKDVDADVRGVAIEQLAARWPGDPLVLKIILGRLHDPDRFVRETALGQLTANFATHSDTLATVHQAAEDPQWTVRCAAVRALDTSWAHTPHTLTVLRHAASDTDEDVRQTAIQALADRWADAPGVRQMVLDAVNDPHQKVGVAAVEQLASRWPDDPDTAMALRRACRSPHGDVQCAALVAFARCGSDTANPQAALLGLLADSPSEDVRRAAIETVAPHGADNPEVLPAVLRATTDPDATVRGAAMRMMAQHWPSHPELRGACLAGARDFYSELRSSSMELLAVHWGDAPDLFPLFLASARDSFWRVRRIAIDTLAARWSYRPEAVTAIEQLARGPGGLLRRVALEALAAVGAVERRATTALSDPDEGVRRTARRLLAGGWRASWSGLEQLKEALDSPRAAIRQTALMALVERYGSEQTTWTAVAEALVDSEPDIRSFAVRSLLAARRNVPMVKAKADVLNATRDPESSVRSLALEALVTRWPTDEATGDAAHRMLRDPSAEIRRIAMETLVRSAPDDPATTEALALGCVDDDRDVRIPALGTLAARRGVFPGAAAAVIGASDNSEAEVREDCIQALGVRWHGAEGVFARIRRATLDPNWDVRLAAMQALTAHWPDRPEALELLDRFRWDDDLPVRCAAYRAIAFLGPDDALSLPLDRSEASAAMTHPDGCHRVVGLTRLLLAWPDHPDTHRAVRIGLRDRYWTVRHMAISDLIRRAPGDEDALTVLWDGLGSPAPVVRQLALWGVATLLPSAAQSRKAVERALDDRDASVRDTAVDLLVKFWADSENGARLLRRMVNDPNLGVRSTSLMWLAAIQPRLPDTASALLERAQDPAHTVREEAMEALLILWPDAPKTVTALQAIGRSRHRETRIIAREALNRRTRGRLRSQDETVRTATEGHPVARADAMTELARRWPDASETRMALFGGAIADSESVRLCAIDLLTAGWPRDPGTLLVLSHAQADANADVRLSALLVLSNDAHPDDPCTAIAAMAADQQWLVRITAIRLLMIRWPDRAETLTVLREAIGDPDWYVRWAAHELLHQRIRVRAEGRWAITCDPTLRTHEEVRELLLSGPFPLPLTPTELLPLWREDTASRERTALILAPLHGDNPELRLKLVAAAVSDDHTVHFPALQALAQWWPEDPETLDTLMLATTHECALARGYALAVLYTRPDQQETARRLAREVLDDPAAAIRWSALEFLEATEPLDATTLLRFTTDPDEDIAAHAIKSLGLQGPGELEVWQKICEAANACRDPGPRYWVEWRTEEMQRTL